jgi:23S rRNA (cytosine1962-C5)-methyltransferase
VTRAVRLDRRTERAVRGGHPWLWPDVLGGNRVRPGDEVAVEDALGNPIGRALAFAADGPVLRMLTLDPRGPPLPSLLRTRLAEAAALRARVVPPGTTAFRLLHGEGDALPGLTVDRFGALLVVRPDGDAWERHERIVVDALRAVCPDVTSMLWRHGPETRLAWGEAPPDLVRIEECGRIYLVRPGHGQKTGFFLDMRENRSRAEALVRPGDRALDLFCFTGGFTVALLRGGAASVVSVDRRESILDDVARQIAANAIPDQRNERVAADIFAWLPAARSQRFHVIVCDPPALAHADKDLRSARAASFRLHEALAPLLADGAILLTASCTARISGDDLLDDAVAGLRSGGRRVTRELFRAGPGPDHPVPPAFPEGRYLNFLALAVA